MIDYVVGLHSLTRLIIRLLLCCLLELRRPSLSHMDYCKHNALLHIHPCLHVLPEGCAGPAENHEVSFI